MPLKDSFRFLPLGAKDGRIVWVHKHASLVRDTAGKPTRMITLITDITGRKRQEDQIDLLMREVNHRSKNILTLVQAIARQTAASQPADFLRCFDERVRALAASQDLLVKSEWKGADLEELIRSQLAHFKDFIDRRIMLDGPPLVVTASAAQALGMALHELATNAGKYGALSNVNGYVCIDWKLKRDGVETIFAISWRERGGPAVQAPEKRGFGSTVICRMAERSLGAKVELLYEPAGVSWRLQCPATEIVDKDRSTALQSGKLSAEDAADSRPKILIVEDEALVGLEIEGVLCGAGFEVLGPARSVAEAMQLLMASSADGAVLDIRLGRETSEPVAIALIDRRIPFVTLSGFSSGQRPSTFDGAPALMKPLEAELLIAQLKRRIREPRAAKVTKKTMFHKC
jgi:two-component sensor histidine kinase/ActR/RegA family two-component response regulator